MKYKDIDGNWKELSIKASDTLPIGAIIPFSGTEAPTNWLICDGSQVSRVNYAELFNIIGTKFGEGDGSTTFNLPDLRGRVITGLDTSQNEFNVIGKSGGEKTHKLTVSEMPTHYHEGLTWAQPYGENINLNAGSGGPLITPDWNNGDGSNSPIYTGVAGGDQPHNILQPYTVTNYIIKAKQSVGVVGKILNSKTTSDKDTYSCDYINGVQGTILYENANGSTDGATLSDEASNYKTLKIYGGENFANIVEEIGGNFTDFTLKAFIIDASGSIYIYSSRYTMSGKNITLNGTRYTNTQITSSGIVVNNEKKYKIFKVVGYK